MCELIRRDKALYALGLKPIAYGPDDEYSLGLRDQWQDDYDAINAVPAATNTDTDTTSKYKTMLYGTDGADDVISRKAAINAIRNDDIKAYSADERESVIREIPPTDYRLIKIAELVEGTIDHFDLDDAMDLLYQIKEVLK